MLYDNSGMGIVLEVLFSIALVGTFTFIGVVRLGWISPRFTRWLNSKLGGNLFYDQRSRAPPIITLKCLAAI